VGITSYKTKSVTAQDCITNRQWWVVDGTNQTVGRLASEIAKLLRGKHKPSFSPHMDMGDSVIVLNAEKVVFTGNKLNDKIYERYSGYPGGKTKTTPREYFDKKPIFVIENAVRGMLPKTKLGRAIFKNLKVYEGNQHNHEAQNPKEIKFTNI